MLHSSQYYQVPQIFIAIAALPAPKTTGLDLPSGQLFCSPAQDLFPSSSAAEASPAKHRSHAAACPAWPLPGAQFWLGAPVPKGLQVAWSLVGGVAGERRTGSARKLHPAPQGSPHCPGSHGSMICQGGVPLPLSRACRSSGHVHPETAQCLCRADHPQEITSGQQSCRHTPPNTAPLLSYPQMTRHEPGIPDAGAEWGQDRQPLPQSF